MESLICALIELESLLPERDDTFNGFIEFEEIPFDFCYKLQTLCLKHLFNPPKEKIMTNIHHLKSVGFIVSSSCITTKKGIYIYA